MVIIFQKSVVKPYRTGWRTLLCLLVCCTLFLFRQADAAAAAHGSDGPRIIQFSGYEWVLKTGYRAPGKNHWSGDNVWVDQEGLLHLKITHTGKRWHCAELMTVNTFGYGDFQFQVIAPLGQLDPNLILGLFVYPSDENPYEDSELDIEIAKWGDQAGKPGNYTVASSKETHRFHFFLEGNYSTHQFRWSREKVLFQSFHGHDTADKEPFSRWVYNADRHHGKNAAPPVRVHMNLWLFLGKAPWYGQEQEVIIKGFVFEPL